MFAKPIYSAAWRAALVLLAVEISIVSALRYFTSIEAPPEPVAANAFASPFLIIHAGAGIVALLAGPLQFVRRLRSSRPAVHRASGRVYVAACALAAPTGFILAIGTTAGPVAGSGFAVSALLVGAFTWLGWRSAVERRFAEHREWMLRSWAITAAAITLRLMLPASGLLGFGFFTAYPVIAWLAWSTNLALVEIHIRRTRAPAAPPREALAAAS